MPEAMEWDMGQLEVRVLLLRLHKLQCIHDSGRARSVSLASVLFGLDQRCKVETLHMMLRSVEPLAGGPPTLYSGHRHVRTARLEDHNIAGLDVISHEFHLPFGARMLRARVPLQACQSGKYIYLSINQ